MDEAQATAQQDQQRVARSFIGALSGYFGLNDQTYAGQDGYAINNPGRYQTIGINGAVSIEGRPYSNVQQRAVVMSPGFLILAGLAAYLVLKK